MKCFTYLLSSVALLVTTFLFAQQQTYNVTFETGTPGGDASLWTSFEGDTPPAEITTNPMANGVNTNATTKVFKLNVLKTNACYAGTINLGKTMGTWKLEAPITTTFTMQVYKSTIGRVGIKMVNATDGTVFELTSKSNTTINQWETMSWDIAPFIASGDNNNVDRIVVFSDFTCGNPDRATGSVTYVDNISWGANKLTNPVVPTCTDGIKNGTETGIDCGGSCSACVVPGPTTAAPIPPVRAATDVISIYGTTYATISGVNYNPGWGQSGGVNTEFNPGGTGNFAMLYNNFNYQGTDFGANIDASSMQYLHVDIWTQNATNVKVSPINNGTGAGEFLVNVPLVSGSWSSIDIPKSSFTGMTWNSVFQLKFDGQAGATPSNIYLDNIYFWKESLSTENFSDSKNKTKISPNPARALSVIQISPDVKTVAIFDVNGQLVQQENGSDFTLGNLKQGIYIVKITHENGENTSQKLIIK